jgi:hypothetical protein
MEQQATRTQDIQERMKQMDESLHNIATALGITSSELDSAISSKELDLADFFPDHA